MHGCADGGVDSSVTAALVERAIGDRLTAIFIDTGLLRANEVAEVQEAFRSGFDMQLVTVDASREFMDALSGIVDPEEKRKIIGRQFIRSFEYAAREHEDAKRNSQPSTGCLSVVTTVMRDWNGHGPLNLMLSIIEPSLDGEL